MQPLPVGLAYTPAGKVVLDPDAGVQQAVRHLFATFTATGSAFATVKAFNRRAEVPPPPHLRPAQGRAHLGTAGALRVLRILHNPRYAGAFFYGRTSQRRLPGGKTTSVALPRDQWTVLIIDEHPGYVTWAEYETNQNRSDRTVRRPRHRPSPRPPPRGTRSAARPRGLRRLRRAHDRALPHPPRRPTARLRLPGRRHPHRSHRCQHIPGGGVDTAIGAFLVNSLTPLALESALAVADELATRADDADRLRATTVERARYHAEQARRRYLAVDPTNRLVADSLEADWNTALRTLQTAREDYQRRHRGPRQRGHGGAG